jgi:hypothetical protein
MHAANIQSRQWLLTATSIILRDLRHRDLTPQGGSYRKQFDCLFKRLALVVGYDHADVLQALSNYVDRPPNHGSIGKLTRNLVKAAIHDHKAPIKLLRFTDAFSLQRTVTTLPAGVVARFQIGRSRYPIRYPGCDVDTPNSS